MGRITIFLCMEVLCLSVIFLEEIETKNIVQYKNFLGLRSGSIQLNRRSEIPRDGQNQGLLTLAEKNVKSGTVISKLSYIDSARDSVLVPAPIIIGDIDAQGRNSKQSHRDLSDKTPQSASSKNTADCGRPEVSGSTRIVGGESTKLGEWPWQAGVFAYDGSDWWYGCGATLIKSNWIVTSAQCMHEDLTSFEIISLGAHMIDGSDSTAKLLALENIICHPDYSSPSEGHDICLAKLVKDVSFTTNIKPACTPTEEESATEGDTCVFTGWGTLSKDSTSYSSTLKQADVNITSRAECQNQHRQVPEDQFCASQNDATVSPCFGDHGSPLVCQQQDSRYVLKGLVAQFAEDCGETSKDSGIFTDVTQYTDWIEETISNTKDSVVCHNPNDLRTCGSTITENGAVLRSPVLNQDTWFYPPGQDCSWYVTAPYKNKIQIEFLCPFGTEISEAGTNCGNDHLTFEEPNGGGGRYCGNFFSNDPYISLSNRLTVRFYSDADDKVANGFVVKITFLEDDGVTITSSTSTSTTSTTSTSTSTSTTTTATTSTSTITSSEKAILCISVLIAVVLARFQELLGSLN